MIQISLQFMSDNTVEGGTTTIANCIITNNKRR